MLAIMMTFSLYCLFLLMPTESFRATSSIRNRACISLNAKSVKRRHVNKDRSASTKDVSNVSLQEELPLLQFADVSKADNFYAGTIPQVEKLRSEAKETRKYDELLAIDKNYYALMDAGFRKRQYTEAKVGESSSFIERASKNIKDQFEISQSKEQQFQELKQQKLRQRSGMLSSVLPDSLSKYVDYVNSLYVKPKTPVIVKNMVIAGFFSFVVWANSSARSSFMYFVIGKLCIISLLLSRNMPQKELKAEMGGARRKIATWSKNSFKTAIGITFFIAALTIGGVNGFLSMLPFKIPGNARVKLSFITSLLSTGYFTSAFEVFEEKDKNGWRWEKAMDTSLPEKDEKALRESVFGVKKFTELYDFEYDPMVDDFPRQRKYINEVEPNSEELEAAIAFQKFLEERKASRRPPLVNTPPTKFGAKKDLYPKTMPTWIISAYKKNVIARNKWSGIPTKFEPIVKMEVPTVEGPMGFRDALPVWVSHLFSRAIWEDRLGVSRAAARAFGTYRRTMWKIDEQVQLQKSDV